ncbi:MAG: DUF1385 domain-containing protein [Candidatus Adiutrix sp.]|jgi:uncharacterized protein YqhQ|nr:DUF1385 domain-containing protein [Candidatus Adiutrix sp.]
MGDALLVALKAVLAVMDIDVPKSSNASASPSAPPNVGGQAVIEGVMMRGPERWAVAVRRAGGALEIRTVICRGWAKKAPILGKPFLRGAVVLLEPMMVGKKALNFSAEIAARVEGEADENGALRPEKKRPAEKPALGLAALALTLASAFGLAMLLFVALPHLLSVFAGRLWGFDETSGLFHLLDGLLKFVFFIAYVGLIGMIPDIKRVYAYHGAEHQAIHAFEAGGPLTAETAARHPAWHPRCGTAFIFLVLALSILLFAAVFPLAFPAAGGSLARAAAGIGLKIVLLLPLAGLAYEVSRLAGQAGPGSFWRALLWPGLLLQRLTTRRPDVSQLETALAALKRAVAPN